MVTAFPLTQQTPLSSDRFRANAVPEAQVGDVIAYDWDNNCSFDHVAIITSIADGNYPNVSEWGTADAIHGHPSQTYPYRGWTWSAIDSAWLQDPHRAHPSPDVTATLFHIVTETTPSY